MKEFEWLGPRSPYAAEAGQLGVLLEEIAEAERQINALAAEQVLRVAEFAERRRMFDRRAHPGWSSESERAVAIEVADARRCSVAAAQYYVADCAYLVEKLPRVMEKFLAGAINLTAARAAAHHTYPVRWEAIDLADQVVAAEIDTVLPGQVAAMVRARVLEIDPDAAETAAREARADRYVSVKDGFAVGTANLTAVNLATEQAAACWHSLDHHARGVHAGGDERTVSQIMSDTLVERVTGQARAPDVPVSVGLVMSDLTLLGASDQPVLVDGLGPVPAAIGRQLATKDGTWIRRLFTDPADGTMATADRRQRLFKGSLRTLILAADRRCRCCGAPIRHADHVTDHAHGGPTTGDNGQGYCASCNHVKQHPGIAVEALGHQLAADSHGWLDQDGLGRFDPARYAELETRALRARDSALTRWTSPIGHHIIGHAPPAMGPGTATRAQLAHRRRLRSRALEPTRGRDTTGTHHQAPDQAFDPARSDPRHRPDFALASALEERLSRILEYAA